MNAYECTYIIIASNICFGLQLRRALCNFGGLRSLHKHETHAQDGDEALVCSAANASTDCVRLLLNSGALVDSHVRATIRLRTHMHANSQSILFLIN